VDPVQPARHPGTGLIKVRHRRGGQPLADTLDEPVQPARALGHHTRKRPRGHRRADHVGQQLRGPVHRQVLVHQQVARQRTHPRPVAGRRPDVVRKRRSGGRPTPAAAPLGSVLAGQQPQHWQVKHLAGLHADHRRLSQVRTAAATPLRDVPDDLVRLGDLGQVRAGGTGLLARPTTLDPLGNPPHGPRGLPKTV
jgi:hypothetical protein